MKNKNKTQVDHSKIKIVQIRPRLYLRKNRLAEMNKIAKNGNMSLGRLITFYLLQVYDDLGEYPVLMQLLRWGSTTKNKQWSYVSKSSVLVRPRLYLDENKLIKMKEIAKESKVSLGKLITDNVMSIHYQFCIRNPDLLQ